MTSTRRTRVLISGATDGIGLLLAKSYAARDISVLATGRRNLVDHTGFFGSENIHYIRADQTDPARAGAAIARALERMEWDALDAAVLNAGIGWHGAAEAETPASIAQQVDVNVTGTILAAHAVAPAVLHAKGRLVLIGSSLSGGAEGFATYSATKAALAGFARSLREEWRGRAQVLLIHPGPTKTAMHDKAGMRLGASRGLFMHPRRAAAGIERAIRNGDKTRNLGRLYCARAALSRPTGGRL